MKKSIVIFADWLTLIEDLTMEERGEIFTYILDYANEKNPPFPSDRALKILCNQFKIIIDANKEKYNKKCESIEKARLLKSNRNQIEINSDTDTVTVTDTKTDTVTVTDTKTDTVTVTDTKTDTVTVTDTKTDTDVLEKIENTIGRALTASDIDMIQRWQVFSEIEILEALKIAIDKKSKNPLCYANSILTGEKKIQFDNTSSGSAWLDNFKAKYGG